MGSAEGGRKRCASLREALESIQIESGIQESLQFCQVGFLIARGWGGCGISAGVPGREISSQLEPPGESHTILLP